VSASLPSFLKAGLKALPMDSANNFGWMAGDKILRMGLGVVVSFLVARHLGPSNFGLLNYALAVVTMAMPFAGLGLDSIIKSELIQGPENASRVLWTAHTLRMLGGLLVFLALIATCGINPLFEENRSLILICALQVFQPTLLIGDLWFQSRLEARKAVLIQWIALGLGVIWRLGLIHSSGSLSAFAWAATAEALLLGLLTELSARRNGKPTLRPPLSLELPLRMMRNAAPLILATLAVMVNMRIDLAMLQTISGSETVGQYSASLKLAELGYFIPSALMASAFPKLVPLARSRSSTDLSIFQRFYDANALLAWAIALPTILLAPWLVSTTYGEAFSGAAGLLPWHALCLPFVFLNAAKHPFLIGAGLTWIEFAADLLGALTKVSLNLLLIPRYGALAAAQTCILAQAIACIVAPLAFPQTHLHARMQMQAMLTPWRLFTRKRGLNP